MNEPLRVALSMATLVRGGMGGSETYARALTEQLALTDAVDAKAFVPASARGFSAGIPERVIENLSVGASTRERLTGLSRIIARSSSIRRSMAGADVVHFPFTVPAPTPRGSQASVQTLHDVQHLELPHMFSSAELLYRRLFYEGFAAKADAVITISHFTKSRLINSLGLDPERVHVAYLGVDAARYTPNLGLRENFVLYPARGWPHKNHARLIEAMTLARRDLPDLRLVLTGGGLENLGELPGWVDRRGLVPQEELLRLYQTASALVFPSLYEGFGLPPLEAMASGCPVAASNAGSLPEVVGDAAVQFDPHNPESIAAGILAAVARREELTQKGLLQVKKFTWDTCRDAHVQAYRAAHERKIA
ncbi:glycosyltransferase family 4 protein [Cryobacterium roopkundense]|uniref:Glycosyltransferase involved in cell wall biosynthesis n=1 Tax=Cryobacterium roopkundense TaxID=1001240 RepID=A0A7W9E4H3_9MICO|nr:glycosyltransferase family 1 protein [Cryobacterium roopkundense]MBB5642141.1 glycosyltransferase involved in cell wall biosynthesis [Cryobacterium roopkundense]